MAYPVSAAFRSAVKGSHTATVRCEAWRFGRKVADLDVIDGSVTLDSRRAVRSTCTLTAVLARLATTTTFSYNTYDDLAAQYATYTALAAAAPSYQRLRRVTGSSTAATANALVPNQLGSGVIAPFGTEVRLWRGVRYQTSTRTTRFYNQLTGTYTTLAATYPSYAAMQYTGGATTSTVTEEVPLGVFVLTETDLVDDGSSLTVTMQGEDRSILVSQNKWIEPYAVSGSPTADTAIAALLVNRYDDTQVAQTSGTTYTVATSVFGQDDDSDPWADAQAIAKSAGLRVYFDRTGRVVIATFPTLENATPVVTFNDATDGTMLSLTRSLTRRDAFNGVVAIAEGTGYDSPARVVVWDDNPNSPTYRFGPFGQAPTFYRSNLVTSTDQLQAAAEALLLGNAGVAESITWDALVDPSLEPDDVVAVTSTATNISKTFLIDSVEIPLRFDGVMRMTGRTVAEVVTTSG